MVFLLLKENLFSFPRMMRPIFERCRQTGSPILFVTSDRRMSDHLLALYPGRSDVVVTPFSRKALAEKTEAPVETIKETKAHVVVDTPAAPVVTTEAAQAEPKPTEK